ncbi:MAG TPA: MFS transporter, partial [Acidimicrobiia bacterium]|nr:MFS transporter [Acidimicrobiia bacterium]
RLAARVGTRAPMVAGMSLGALGVSLFVAAGASSGSIFLLVGMALAGCGLALNTAPMVAAVMRSAPEARGAFASAVNNTARQVGAALGVAVLGGIAGDPGGASFVEGLHVAAVVTAIAWLAAAVVASLSVRVRVRDGTRARASARLRQGA